MPEERKLVTILFADVTGSTMLGETLDPEDVRVLMGRYYAHARRIVSDHGGTLEKFIGDAVMAVFGLPHAHGDDAERAVAAALALRDAIANDTLLGGSLLLRIGVNTGEVVTTSDASGGDFLITGDAVNVAARLQQGANPGEVVVGERTMKAAQAAFLFGDVRQVEVKGKRQPLRVFPLREARAKRLVGRPPLVGRKQDLLQLSVLQMRTLEEQRPQLVSIVAPAGTGKTRLLEEFLARLDAEAGFRVATARCLPYGQTLTYWPLRGLLTELLGSEVAKARVAEAFVRGGHTPEDAARLADLVLTTLGVEREGATDRESIFTAWRLLIEALAREAPRIVIFEDLHWASDSLLDLVEHIMHLRTQAPFLLIALSRPELLDRRPTWGGGGQNFTSLALQPLSAAQTRELVERLMQELPKGIRDSIVERSGGNPFFVLELIRGLAERGLVGENATLGTLPDTVHAAVLARLDLLSTQERTVLQAASVASRSFHTAMLHTILKEYAVNEIDSALDGLLARDLIVPAEDGAYSFRHVLIRDVAYGTLSRKERVRLHGQIAAWVEANAADRLDEFTELIAYHYREAVLLARQSAVSLDLPFDPAHAIRFLERAGELASRSGAFAEAYNYLQSAIDIAPQVEHARLYEKLGDYVVFADAAVTAYHKGLECWRASQAGDPVVGARLLRKLLIGYMRYQSFVTVHPKSEEMVSMRTEARRLAEEAGDENELWRIRIADHLWWPQWRGNITPEEAEEAQAVALAAAVHFEEHGDWASFSEVLDGYANLSLLVGAKEEALEASKRWVSAPKLPAAERSEAMSSVASTYRELGDFDRSIATVREALTQLQPSEPMEQLSFGIGVAVWAAWVSGRWSEIDDLISILAGIWEQVQHLPGTTVQIAEGYWVALLLALAREDHAAIEAAASVLRRTISERTSIAHALLTAFLEGDMSKLDLKCLVTSGVGILMSLNEYGVRLPADSIARAHSLPGDWAKHVVGIAEALVANDLVRLETTIDQAEAHGLIPHAARMRIILAQRLETGAPLERARQVLEKLGDRQFLRRLDEVAASLNKSAEPQ